MATKPKDIAALKPAPYNPRQIAPDAAAGLAASMRRFGDIAGITFNTRTGHLVAGHQRVQQLREMGAQLVEDDGALWVELGTERHRVRLVDWDHETEVQANLSANNPHIAGIFTEDLDEVLREVEDLAPEAELAELNLDRLLEEADALAEEALAEAAAEGEGVDYSSKIDGPVYEVKGERPALADLYQTDRLRALLQQVDESGVADDEKHYLRHAAYRHVVYSYGKAAEYYAHASPEMQRLMEASALVIPDFDRALELGFVKLTDRLHQLYDENRKAPQHEDTDS